MNQMWSIQIKNDWPLKPNKMNENIKSLFWNAWVHRTWLFNLSVNIYSITFIILWFKNIILNLWL